jgi:hypothetical protein
MVEFVFEVMYQLEREAIVFGYGAYGIPFMLSFFINSQIPESIHTLTF